MPDNISTAYNTINVVIDKGKLTSYNESVSALKLAIKNTSDKSEKAISSLRSFLLEYLTENKHQKNVIDSQNFYFSKKMAEQAIAILQKNVKVSQKNISSYVKNALLALDLDSFFYSKKDVDGFIKNISDELKEIVEATSEKVKNENEDGKKSKATTEKEKASKINDLVKKNLYTPNVSALLYSIVPTFLEKNVFSNIRGILKGQSIKFDTDALKIINTKTLNNKTIFNTLYVPDISGLYKRFKQFEWNATRGVIYRTKEILKKARKRIYDAVNFFFPVKIIATILKVGTSIVRNSIKLLAGTMRLGIRIVSSALKFTLGTFKFVVGTTLKIGSAALSILSKTLNRIGAFKLLKITAKGMFAFLKTYAGAYFLGYVIGTIYKNFGKILNFAKGVFNTAKSWFNEHIYEPWISPMLEWFRTNSFTFYLKEIADAFGDGSTLSESIDNIVSEFTLYKDGKPLFDFEHIKREISTIESWIANNLSNPSELILDSVAPLAGGALVSIAGAHLGAALGTMIFPGIGTVAGGIIGSLLGGMAGENLGGIIRELIKDNAPFQPNSIDTHETKFERYSRMHFGFRNKAKEAFFTPAKTAAMESLKKVGAMAAELDYMDKSSYDPLIASGLFTIHEIEEKLKDSDSSALFREQMSLFKNIGRFSYDSFYKEIASSFKEMGTRLLNSSHRGAIFSKDIQESDFETTLTLHDSGKERLSNSVKNPFWFKVVRAMILQENLNNLLHRKIRPNEFIDLYNALSKGDRNAILKERSQIYFNNANVSVDDLLFKTYTDSDIPMEEIQNWKKDAIDTWMADPGNQALAYGAAHARARGYQGADHIDDRVKSEIEKITSYINASNVVYWLPTDKQTGFWKKMFSERQIESQDIHDILTKNISYNPNEMLKNFNGKYGDAFRRILNENPEYRGINASNVAYRLNEVENATEEDIKAAIRAELNGEEYGLLSLIGNRLLTTTQQLQSNVSDGAKEELTNKLNEVVDDSDISSLAALVVSYRDMISKNNSFMNERLLPLLKALSEKGMPLKDMGHIFGFIYNAGANRIERYDEEKDFSGGIAFPNVL